jgi:hypothetical protein
MSFPPSSGFPRPRCRCTYESCESDDRVWHRATEWSLDEGQRPKWRGVRVALLRATIGGCRETAAGIHIRNFHRCRVWGWFAGAYGEASRRDTGRGVGFVAAYHGDSHAVLGTYPLGSSPSELLASPSELLAPPSEPLASPSELSASPSEPLASPSELVASPSELLASAGGAIA